MIKDLLKICVLFEILKKEVNQYCLIHSLFRLKKTTQKETLPETVNTILEPSL